MTEGNVENAPLRLVAICRGDAERLGTRKTRTGIFKHPVGGPVMVDHGGIVGDRVMNRTHHGGPDQALLIDGLAALAAVGAAIGHFLAPGTLGENLVIEGLDTQRAAVGDRLRIGALLVELTAPRMPCSTLALRMGDPAVVKRYLQAGLPGLYARVLAPGTITAGDPVTLEPFGGDRMTLAALMQALAGRPAAAEVARILALPVASRVRKRYAA